MEMESGRIVIISYYYFTDIEHAVSMKILKGIRIKRKGQRYTELFSVHDAIDQGELHCSIIYSVRRCKI